MIRSVIRTEYKGLAAYSLENDLIKTVVVPELGGKITSMQLKKSKKEYLYQLESSGLRRVEYGGDYLKSEMCGFDDMFPTISEYHYEQFPWSGSKIPDHGEVWSLKWDRLVKDDSILLYVHGIKLPYILSKEISLEGDAVRISYIAKNPTDFDMDFLWSGHIMLNASQGCRHIPPPGVTKAVSTYSESGLIGDYGTEFDYPHVKQLDGSTYDVSLHRGIKADDFQKFYFNKDLHVGEYSLIYPDGHKITVEFPLDKIPCVAGINAEGGSFGVECAYLEPCSAPFDRPDVARLHNKSSIIKARSNFSWDLVIRLNRQ